MANRYDKSKIMRNAWYLRKVQPATGFSACLRKAWRNEKLAVMAAKIENRQVEEPKPSQWKLLANVPADYYGVQGRYYGD